MLSEKDPAIFYNAIQTFELHPSVMQKLVNEVGLKGRIRNYLLSLPDEENYLFALQACIDPNTKIGKFCDMPANYLWSRKRSEPSKTIVSIGLKIENIIKKMSSYSEAQPLSQIQATTDTANSNNPATVATATSTAPHAISSSPSERVFPTIQITTEENFALNQNFQESISSTLNSPALSQDTLSEPCDTVQRRANTSFFASKTTPLVKNTDMTRQDNLSTNLGIYSSLFLLTAAAIYTVTSYVSDNGPCP